MVDTGPNLHALSSNYEFKGSNAQSAGLSREKQGQGGEYFAQYETEEEQAFREAPYVDRSSLLTATLNSFAMFNIANILKNKTISRSMENKYNKAVL